MQTKLKAIQSRLPSTQSKLIFNRCRTMIEISNWSQLTQHPQQTKDRTLKNKQKKQLTSSRKKNGNRKKELKYPDPVTKHAELNYSWLSPEHTICTLWGIIKVRQTVKYVTAEPGLSVFRRYGKAQRPQVWKSSASFHLQLFKKISWGTVVNQQGRKQNLNLTRWFCGNAPSWRHIFAKELSVTTVA